MLNKTLLSFLKIVIVIGVLGAMGCGMFDNDQAEGTLTEQEKARFKEIANNSWTEEEKEGAIHFLLSLEAARIGSEKTNSEVASLLASPLTGTREEKIDHFRKIDEKLLPYFVKALEEGRLVQDEMLDKIHPQLKQHFHNEHLRSLENRVAKTGENWKPFLEDQTILENWVAWLTDHRDEFDIPFEMEE